MKHDVFSLPGGDHELQAFGGQISFGRPDRQHELSAVLVWPGVVSFRSPAKFELSLCGSRQAFLKMCDWLETHWWTVHGIRQDLMTCKEFTNEEFRREYLGTFPNLETAGPARETCPECYGTGYQRGFGRPCTRGCRDPNSR